MNHITLKEELINTDLLFGQLWEISVDGMRLIDEDGNILLVNDSFCKTFQMDKEQLIGKPFSIVYSVNEQDAALKTFQSDIGKNAIKTLFERENTLNNGIKVWGFDPTKEYAIQGFANAGQRAALLHKELLGGGKLVAVSDSRGAIYNKDGFDPLELVQHKLKTGSVLKFPGAKVITHEELLELDVEVLYPAALENVITSVNANKIKAKIVCELANGPTTLEADIILYKNGVHVIPDILASAGGVTVSCFEMVQDKYTYFWDEEIVHQRLDKKLTQAYHRVQEAIREKKVHPRLAAMVVGVARVAEACKLRGWV